MVFEQTPLKGRGTQPYVPARPVTLLVARAGKMLKGQRLLILRGFIKSAAGRVKSFQVRAMLDSGAEGNFISPGLAERIGARIEQGNFGQVVQAFGSEARIKGAIRELHVEFHGNHPQTKLASRFSAQTDTLVAPGEFDGQYDLLLGQPFLEQFGAQLRYGAQGCIRLTQEDGAETEFPTSLLEEGDEESMQPESDADLTKMALSCARRYGAHRSRPKEPTGAQKRQQRRIISSITEDDDRRAARARAEMPGTVMTVEELERLCRDSPGETVTITPIFYTGWRDTPGSSNDGARIRVNQVTARGVEASKAASSPPPKEDKARGQLPAEERATATTMEDRMRADYPDVFTSELPPLDKLPVPEGPGVQIVLKEGAQPVGRYGPRMTHEDTAEAGRIIEELLKKGFIRPSRSPWGAPMFLVAKPDGSKRMVIDYRALNSATVRNRYPLPKVDELFDQLQGARYFSTIDLRTGYWQIRMAADAVEKTAFTSRHGHFEWLVLPMGLTNAPAEFMALMETTFREELNKFVLCFLDDILVYSKTLEEHERHLRAVLDRLRAKKLHAKISKCEFFRAEVEFLGHYVGRAGVRMVEGKVDAVRAWPTPTKQKDVEQFIGLAGYYRRFIANFSQLAAPLTALCGTLKKATGPGLKPTDRWKAPVKKFVWGSEQQEAFDALKEAVSGAPCLAMPDPDREFVVHTDASGYATGAVLMQKFDEGLRPIAFLSKKMKQAEKNYPIYEQELLAILHAMRAWRHYLGGRHFTVWTDHQSLQYVEVSAMATPRQVRWAALLSEFDFTVKYAPGKTNVVADGLSRAAAGGPDEHIEVARDGPRLYINAIREIKEIQPMPVRIRRAAMKDSDYQALMKSGTANLQAHSMAVRNGLLYRTNGDSEQLVVPKNEQLRTWLLSWGHDATEGGHRGGARLGQWLSARVWWAGMADAAQRYASSCTTCQRNKSDQRGKQGMPLSAETPRSAGQTICMDFIGPLPRAAGGQKFVFVIIDKLTRYVMYIPLGAQADAGTVYQELEARWMAVFGAPRTIISDRDARFTSKFWEGVWETMGTKLKRSTAFHPQTDGATENANKQLIVALRAYVDEQKENWATLLPQLQRATNSSQCASTGFTPDFMLFGKEIPSGLDADLEAARVDLQGTHPGARELHAKRQAAWDMARDRIKKAQAKQRADSARGRRPATIKAGDRVWLANRNMRSQDTTVGARKLEALYHGPYKVLKMHGSNAARLQLPAGCRLHPVFNLDLLKPYIDGAQEFPSRPARFSEQGPLEEDPEAGGPASGDPIYEVERIVDVRGRGARMEYLARWTGWPPETATWLGKDNWGGCEELIAEFRQRAFDEAGRRRVGLHALRKVAPEIRAQRKALAEARRAVTEAERKRRHMAEMNIERAADRPPMDKQGKIDMGENTCIAEVSLGRQCTARTRHGYFCEDHRAARDGTRIKQSNKAEAGLGLFAERAFIKDEFVAHYTGDLIRTEAGDKRAGFEGSHYVFQMTEQWSLDAARTDTADGRMINDPKGTGKRGNTRFVLNTKTLKVHIKTARKIAAGEEFLLPYGRGFWTAARADDSSDDEIEIIDVELEADTRTQTTPPVANKLYPLFKTPASAQSQKLWPIFGAREPSGPSAELVARGAQAGLQPKRTARKGLVAQREAARGRDPRGEVPDDPIEVNSARVYHIGMIRRTGGGGEDTGGAAPGSVWLDHGHWQCGCPPGQDANRRSRNTGFCNDCQCARPPEELRPPAPAPTRGHRTARMGAQGGRRRAPLLQVGGQAAAAGVGSGGALPDLSASRGAPRDPPGLGAQALSGIQLPSLDDMTEADWAREYAEAERARAGTGAGAAASPGTLLRVFADSPKEARERRAAARSARQEEEDGRDRQEEREARERRARRKEEAAAAASDSDGEERASTGQQGAGAAAAAGRGGARRHRALAEACAYWRGRASG